MNQFLDFKFWFNMRPGELAPNVQKYLVVGLVILLIFSIIFKILKSRPKNIFTKIWAKFSSLAITNLIVGLFIAFFCYEALPFLSMRIWLLLWGLSMVGWFSYIVYQIIQLPKIKAEKEKEKEFNKYIP